MQKAETAPLIRRRSLRQDVERILRDWIVEGRLAGDERLEEARLTQQLGVSRTPVREALLALECGGLVRSEPNKGFRVAPFDARVVREVYPIVGSLEALAVRASGGSLATRVVELRKLNGRMRKAADEPATLYRLDLEWHARLWEACPNRALVDLIRTQKQHVRRFDGASNRGLANLLASCREHDAIADCIERGDVEGAAGRIEEHWKAGTEVVLEWLAGRKGTSE